MVDKARRTAPLAITCTDGEQPTAAKITAINNQLRSATNVLEKAVGDLWNQSGDNLLYTYHLQIPNLARQLGESKYLSPCLYPVDEDFVYVDNIGTKFDNQNDLYLQFKPKTGTSITIVTDATSVLSNSVASRDLVVSAGDYYVDISTGRLISFTELASDIQVSYTVDSTEWNTRTDTLPGVIPDPRQADFTACRISQSDLTYYIHLPPRVPLSYDHDGGAFDGWSLPDRYPPSGDLSDNYDTTVAATGAKKLWQDPTYAALGDNFYRYSLPKEMKDQIASMTEGDTLPLGFLLLWDKDTGTIVADAVFKRGPDATQEWVFEIESSTVNFSTDATSTEDEVSYNGSGYVVIACGSPVARSLWILNNALINHTHGNDGDFTSPMEHSKLINLNPPTSEYTGNDHDSRYPTDVPAWAPSRWEHDDHISLLSRAGSPGVSTGRHRDVNDNAMLGNLVMASTTVVSGNQLNDSANSYGIYFGDPTTSRAILYVTSTDAITANNPTGVGLFGLSTNGIGLRGQSTSDAGVYGLSQETYGVSGEVASGGTAGVYGYGSGGQTYGVYGVSVVSYGVVAESDTTTPAAAAFRIVPQDTEPTTGVEGDIYVNSTTNKMHVYLDGGWREAATA
jgi:hypothetical protein